MFKQHLYFGSWAEEAAVNLLRKNDYKILVRNYKTKLGEIDIIARHKDTFAFIEVKARHSDRFGKPSESVSRSKQRRISKVALKFLKENELLNAKARFDVVSIVYSEQGEPKIDLIKDAFELDQRYTY